MTHEEQCSECSLCTHIYVLPPPNGIESIGKCKLCGIEKIHLNFGNERAYMKEWNIRDNDRNAKKLKR